MDLTIEDLPRMSPGQVDSAIEQAQFQLRRYEHAVRRTSELSDDQMRHADDRSRETVHHCHEFLQAAAAEFESRPWQRYVQQYGGVLHRPTCARRPRRAQLQTHLSGADVPALAQASTGRACTTCLPELNSSAEFQQAREGEKERLVQARQAREEARSERLAAQAAREIFMPDGSPLLDSGRRRIVATRTAWVELVNLMQYEDMGWGDGRYRPVIDRIKDALAHRLNRPVDDIEREAAARMARRKD